MEQGLCSDLLIIMQVTTQPPINNYNHDTREHKQLLGSGHNLRQGREQNGGT